MSVTGILPPLANVAPSRPDASREEVLISASEIKRILYLAVPGGVDTLRAAEEHSVDTYA